MPEEVKDVKTTEATTTSEPDQSQAEPQASAEATAAETAEPEKRGPTGWVPKSRLDEVITERNRLREDTQRERDERIRAEERARLATAQQANEKTWTPSELRTLVNEARITEDQMFAQLDYQSRKQTLVEVAKFVETRDRVKTTDDKLTRYSQYVPDWNRPGTDANRKAEAEYAKLIAAGAQPTKYTELLALERALGDLASLERMKRSDQLTSENRETDQPAIGGSNGRPAERAAEKDPLKTLTTPEHEEYQRLINARHYAGWDEVRAEVKSGLENPFNRRFRDRATTR